MRKLWLYKMKLKNLRAKESEPKTIVNESELQQYLTQGWDISTVLPSGKIVVTKINQIGP